MRWSGRSGTLTGKPAARGRTRVNAAARGAGEPIFSGGRASGRTQKLGGPLMLDGPPTPHATLGRHKRGIGMKTLPRSPTASGIVTRQGGDEAWLRLRELSRGSRGSAGGGLANRAPVPPGAKRWAGCAETLFSSSCPGKTSPARPALDGHRKPPRCLTSWGVTVSITWIEELAARQFDRRLTRSRPHVRTGLSDRARAQ